MRPRCLCLGSIEVGFKIYVPMLGSPTIEPETIKAEAQDLERRERAGAKEIKRRQRENHTNERTNIGSKKSRAGGLSRIGGLPPNLTPPGWGCSLSAAPERPSSSSRASATPLSSRLLGALRIGSSLAALPSPLLLLLREGISNSTRPRAGFVASRRSLPASISRSHWDFWMSGGEAPQDSRRRRARRDRRLKKCVVVNCPGGVQVPVSSCCMCQADSRKRESVASIFVVFNYAMMVLLVVQFAT
ncbi:uncharacterized protein LOC115738174 [Rhodamnia argentea]|uniref:Uncharacterized protein LOC115738174 n=1 Tax=Rhodamnia argentea TaxID=178133 RepID=A0ABM3HUP2_9MYRT|nr:uncharacterized protein LOC115738174 [Rhodamnia argentea]